jgi:hypothetical protein
MYKILGADGRQYGPVSAEQLRRWIIEGRANAYTQTLAEGSATWKPLGSLPEFAAHFPSAVPPAASPAIIHHRKTNAYALWGLVSGIVAVFFCWCCCLNIPVGALGLIFSLIGLSQIHEFPDVYEGRAVAIAGIVLSGVGLLLAILILMADVTNGNLNFHSFRNFHRY